MTPSSASILEQFRTTYTTDIQLTLHPAYRALLKGLGSPHLHLPPVFHVAGTNGKGSTCAFLRAILEAAGKKVHVYTSPHLVRFHERIRVAGELISEEFLVTILQECESLTQPQEVSHFEAITAAAFTAFARTPADYTILEVGMGGRLDATNVIEHPLATLITRLSYDHCKHLGNTLTAIATEKAGIMKSGAPCFAMAQPDAEATRALTRVAQEKNVSLYNGGTAWRITPRHDGFTYEDATRRMELPAPALLGTHQYQNAGLAIAALSALPTPIPHDIIATGLRNVAWPARMQQLRTGNLTHDLPQGWELWLDGGHNDSAGEILATHIATWRKADARPLFVIVGMLNTKNPVEFLSPFATMVDAAATVTIPDEPLTLTADALIAYAHTAGIKAVSAAPNVSEAIRMVIHAPTASVQNARILICGSLYLAGHVLACNEQPSTPV